MRKQWILEGLMMIIICLYVFVTVNKLVGFEPFITQLKQQRLLKDFATLIAVMVPIWHAALVVLMLIPKTRMLGIWTSMITIMTYNLYIGAMLTEKFGPIPCNCVGIWHTMSWEAQFIINFGLLALHFYCIYNKRYFEIANKQQSPLLDPSPSL